MLCYSDIHRSRDCVDTVELVALVMDILHRMLYCSSRDIQAELYLLQQVLISCRSGTETSRAHKAKS